MIKLIRYTKVFVAIAAISVVSTLITGNGLLPGLQLALLLLAIYFVASIFLELLAKKIGARRETPEERAQLNSDLQNCCDNAVPDNDEEAASDQEDGKASTQES